MTRKGRLLVLLVVLVAVVGAGAAVAVARMGHLSGVDSPSSAGTAGTVPTDGPGAEQSAPAAAPSATGGETRPPSAPTTGTTAPSSSAAAPAAGREVQVALGYADWDPAGKQVEAAGFVPDVIQSGGVCTLTLARGSTSVTATGTGRADAKTTTCGALTIPGSQVSPGTWQATLSYRSDTAHGTSAPMSVTVPAP